MYTHRVVYLSVFLQSIDLICFLASMKDTAKDLEQLCHASNTSRMRRHLNQPSAHPHCVFIDVRVLSLLFFFVVLAVFADSTRYNRRVALRLWLGLTVFMDFLGIRACIVFI